MFIREVYFIQRFAGTMKEYFDPQSAWVLILKPTKSTIKFNGLLEMNWVFGLQTTPFFITMERAIITGGARRFRIAVFCHPVFAMGTGHALLDQRPPVLSPCVRREFHTLHFIVRNP